VAAKIARMIDEKSFIFWQANDESLEPPMRHEGIARLISEYLNKNNN
jgi:hypothetical protein